MTIEQLRVATLRNAHDIHTISTALQRISGVRRVQVSLNDHTVRVEHDGSVTVAMLVQAINRVGHREVAVLV